MQRFFENKLTFAAILLLFALAMVCNATVGGSQSKDDDWLMTAATRNSAVVQKGPNLPPHPLEWRASNSVQKGPNIPPDPWEWNKAQKGPNIPPDPWEWRAGNSVHKGPNIPPDPWEWLKAV
jgi:hypothetical protein